VAASCQPTWTLDHRPGSCPKSSTDRSLAACFVRHRVAALVPRVEVFAEGTWPTIAFATRQRFARERDVDFWPRRVNASHPRAPTHEDLLPAAPIQQLGTFVFARQSKKQGEDRRTYHGRYHIVAGRDEKTAAAGMFVIEGGIRNPLHNRRGHAASSVVNSLVRPSLATFSAEWRPPT
jgi:hypothetical protein